MKMKIKSEFSQEHKGHEVTSFTDGLHKYSSTLDSLVAMCREKINTVRDQLELINRYVFLFQSEILSIGFFPAMSKYHLFVLFLN